MDTNDPDHLNDLNEKLLHSINQSGKAYFTHTKIDSKYAIRFVIGQTNVTEKHVKEAWLRIVETCGSLNKF